MTDTPSPQPPESSPPSGPATPPSEPPPPYVIPVRYTPVPGAAPVRRRPVWTILLVVALAVSVGLNVLGFFALQFLEAEDPTTVSERFHSGKAAARDKIAIVKMDGIIGEGAIPFLHKQINQAASDPNVKAVVLRINSPGGTISASDDIYRRLIEFRDGKNPQQKGGKKPLVVSMGGMAASGGYYIAMPAECLFAETTTLTGSIGVYAAFPNVAAMGEKLGFGINLIKAGDVKDSGSPFKKMTPQERQVWQDMVDQAYDRFTEVVEQGRTTHLKVKLRDVVPWTVREVPVTDAHGNPLPDDKGEPKLAKYARKVADGGIWTAKDAEKLGLIDKIDYLDGAIKDAAQRAGLSADQYKVVAYEKPVSLLGSLLGIRTPQPVSLSAGQLAESATPRLWYLAPQAEMAGILAVMGKE
jgi:protease-4